MRQPRQVHDALGAEASEQRPQGGAVGGDAAAEHGLAQLGLRHAAAFVAAAGDLVPARDELAAFEKAGVATLFPAYSRVPGYPYRYVQHALEGAADEVWAAMQADAVVYVCGNASTMAPGVRAAASAAQ